MSNCSSDEKVESKPPMHIDTLPDLAEDDNQLIKIGIAAMDRKARSKPMRNILSRLVATNKFECIIFGDKVILDEDVENWPVCDFLISFFSTGFPMDKAIRYVNLRNPIPINDLPLQKVHLLFWDRRLVLAVLDKIGVPTPRRCELNRDGGPKVDKEVAKEIERRFGLKLNTPRPTPKSFQVQNDTALLIDGVRMEKPFVEKPVSGEDHNIHIYFGGGNGGRKLFRKIANQSSILDPELSDPRTEGSFIYEQFMKTDNYEDIKIYTLGPDIVHAETRKSPVVDGIVKRNLDGKEIRYVVELTPEEREIARKISTAEELRHRCEWMELCQGKRQLLVARFHTPCSSETTDKCADTLAKYCLNALPSLTTPSPKPGQNVKRKPTVSSWKLKAMICVFRHADRTPKSMIIHIQNLQLAFYHKLKFNFVVDEPGSRPFIKLLQGRKDEIILRTSEHLQLIASATDEAISISNSDHNKLGRLKSILSSKMGKQGLKAQLKPSFKTEDDSLEKITIVIKWGGEFTHAARYQSRDIAENFAKDLRVMSKTMLDDVTIFTSSDLLIIVENVEGGSLQLLRFLARNGLREACKAHSKTEPKTIPLVIRKDLLDDSNAAKEPMDRVKKRLKVLLRHNQGVEVDWPIVDKEPFDVVQEVISILKEQRDVMYLNWETIDLEQIQSRWCCGECPILFRERWDKLFSDWCDGALDPSRVCELYDSLKYDSLHNRTFLETIFSNSSTWASPACSDGSPPLVMPGSAPSLLSSNSSFSSHQHFNPISLIRSGETSPSSIPASMVSLGHHHHRQNSHKYPTPQSADGTAKEDDAGWSETESLQRLRKLYKYAKLLFDLSEWFVIILTFVDLTFLLFSVAPQEYGIDPSEKREIALLTSLPLLHKVLSDLNAAKESQGGLARFYFTKESHMHTLVNLIKLSKLKLAHRDVMELDYMVNPCIRNQNSYLSFEVYERISEVGKSEHSVRISLSEGAHGIPLDTSLDAKHALQVIPRRQLIPHKDLDEVIESLQDWGENLWELKKSTTPHDGFLPLEGEDVFSKETTVQPVGIAG
ncbi:hypothetical protein VP01_406g3 [Puccinia sorghi]|uniref:Inositol hexakisphosphate and diphosphoinositol-pentakisphosphate kinase n=1 Tax=Puccinia sorghi TaxID=27349 RepID=A0A0L6USC0_9BASI|nr:hypothetical protein VP01_406g3 [Puccinia sorghi]